MSHCVTWPASEGKFHIWGLVSKHAGSLDPKNISVVTSSHTAVRVPSLIGPQSKPPSSTPPSYASGYAE